MSEWIVFSDKEQQEKIVKECIKLINYLLKMTKEEKDNYFKSKNIMNKFKL